MGKGASKLSGGNTPAVQVDANDKSQFPKLSARELVELSESLEQTGGDINTDQRWASTHYFQTSESFALNKTLRSGNELKPAQQEIYDGLMSAMKPAPQNFRAMRMVGDTFLGSLGVTDKRGWYTDDTVDGLVGTEFTTPQFTSTSAIRQNNVFKGRRPCELDLRVKKGTSIYVSPKRDDVGMVAEGEVLLAPNTPFKVIGARTVDRNNIRLVVEVG